MRKRGSGPGTRSVMWLKIISTQPSMIEDAVAGGELHARRALGLATSADRAACGAVLSK